MSGQMVTVAEAKRIIADAKKIAARQETQAKMSGPRDAEYLRHRATRNMMYAAAIAKQAGLTL